MTLHLENNGLGPAYIKVFQVLLEGKEIESLSTGIEKLFTETGGIKADYKVLHKGHMHLTDNYAIRAGQSREAVVFTFELLSEDADATIAAEMNRLDLVVHYASIYGEPQGPLDSRKNKNEVFSALFGSRNFK